MSGLILPYRGVMPTIGDDVFIAPGSAVIGKVTIGRGSSIWFNCVLRGDVHHITVGENTNIQDGTVVHVTRNRYSTDIGSNITIGHGCILHGCRLEDNCFIGMGALVMDNVVVESGAMVAAGAQVTPGKIVRSGELWGGRPAKMMRLLTEEEKANFPVSSEHYHKLALEYLEEPDLS